MPNQDLQPIEFKCNLYVEILTHWFAKRENSTVMPLGTGTCNISVPNLYFIGLFLYKVV